MWDPYREHRADHPFNEVAFSTGSLKCIDINHIILIRCLGSLVWSNAFPPLHYLHNAPLGVPPQISIGSLTITWIKYGRGGITTFCLRWNAGCLWPTHGTVHPIIWNGSSKCRTQSFRTLYIAPRSIRMFKILMATLL